jgi:hypothetical protein
VFEVTLGRVVDDVFEAHVDALVAELNWEHLIGLVTQAVEEQWVYGCRLFSYESC